MRVLTWNILHGGGPDRSPRILMEILGLAPDLVILTEARRSFAARVAGAFADFGLSHCLGPDAPEGVNGVMLLAREPLDPVVCADVPECLRPRWLEAVLTDRAVRIAAAHLPEASRQAAHRDAWKYLLRRARAHRDEPVILGGDLNTWRDGPDSRRRNGATATNLGRLASLGYVDAWIAAGPRPGAPTWNGPRGESFRLDYVMVSSPLAGSISAARLLTPRGSERLSDHLPIVVDISLAS